MNTCSTCRHWKPEFEGADDGKCENVKVINRVWTEHQQGPIWFRKEFGCIFHATDEQRQPSGSVSVPETQESPSDHHGFPPTNEEEIKAFWSWMNQRLERGECFPDEKPHVGEGSDPIPPKFLIERFRRHKEQQTKAGK